MFFGLSELLSHSITPIVRVKAAPDHSLDVVFAEMEVGLDAPHDAQSRAIRCARASRLMLVRDSPAASKWLTGL